MMHEPEKSDPSIVAMKSVNSSGRSEVESMEPREGAKGNTNQPRTCRTQSRESMSSGLERVRERARQEKKERFTALLHHVDVGLLRTAYGQLRRTQLRVWTDRHGSNMGRTWKLALLICMRAFIGEPIRRSPRGGS